MQPKELHATDRLLLLERDGWEYVERKKGKAAVGIIAITGDGEIVLTEQARKPVDARLIDLPAGLIGDEDPGAGATETAKRELEEETGYTCERIELLTTTATSPGITSEKVVIARAHGIVRQGEGGGVEGETIIVHVVPLAEAHEWLRAREHEGMLVDLKVWTALYFVAKSA